MKPSSAGTTNYVSFQFVCRYKVLRNIMTFFLMTILILLKNHFQQEERDQQMRWS